MKYRSLNIILILLFGFSVTYQFFGPYARRVKMIEPDLTQYIPKSISGWRVEDLPIAESPEMLKVVEGILRYDASSFRVYRSKNTEISVFLAYWLPGKVDNKAIEAHTPDICWVHNGWRMEIKRPLPKIRIDGFDIPVDHYRGFNIRGNNSDVVFWLISGSEVMKLSSISEGDLTFTERVTRRISQVFQVATTEPKPQLFIRVSVNGNISSLMDSEPLKIYLKLMACMIRDGKL